MSKCNCECPKEDWTPQVGDVVEVVYESTFLTNYCGKLYSIIKIDENGVIYLDNGCALGWGMKSSLKLIIPAKTALAIEGSVRKWLDMVYKGGVDRGSFNCPLCLLFYSKGCAGCPISQRADARCCENTPYLKWTKHQDISHAGLLPFKVYCPECAKLALDFANWIGALLPETTFNLIKKEYEEFMEKEIIKKCSNCKFSDSLCPMSNDCQDYSKWQPKDTTCPTCKQPLPIKQEYCCEPFHNAVLATVINPVKNQPKWQHDNMYYTFCQFCGKTPIPPVRKD